MGRSNAKDVLRYFQVDRLILAGICILAINIVSCKPEREVDPINTGPKASTDQSQTTDSSQSATTVQNSAQTTTLVQCRNQSGVLIPGQYTDLSQNTNSDYENCYDASGQLVYQGNAQSSNCYDELYGKFGNNLIYQVQGLFPGFYAQCLQSTSNQMQCINDGLKAKSCSQIN